MRAIGTYQRSSLVAVVLLVLACLSPLAGDAYFLIFVTQLMVYGIFAMSLSLVWGYGGILCFGQAVYFGIGAYGYTLIVKGMVPGFSGVFAGSIPALFLAVVGAVLFAVIIGYFLFYGRLSGPYLGIVTLAIAVIMERIAVNWYYIGGFNGLFNIPVFSAAGFEFIMPVHLFYLVLFISTVVYLGLTYMVESPFGTILKAIRDNEIRAESFGFNSAQHKIITFAIGAGVAAISGVLFAVTTEFVSPSLIGFGLSTEVLIWVALGGKDIILASFLGAILVRTLESYLSELMAHYWLLIIGLFFVIAVIVFPRGIFGKWLSPKQRHNS